MASSDEFLASLFGTPSGSASDNDLGAFQKSIAADDYWKMAAAPVLGAKFDRSTWSPLESLGVSAGQSFLGALLQGLGQRDESAQLEKVASVLPQLYKDPLSVAAPEGVDPQAFNTLKLQAVANQEKNKSSAISDLFKQQKEVELAGAKKKAETQGEIQGQKEEYGKTGLENPNDPNVKHAYDVEAEVRNTLKSAPITQQYQIRNSALQNILANIKNDSVYGDLALVNGFQKIQDPEGSVRQGDVDTIQGAQDRLTQAFGDVSSWYLPNGRLKPEYREKLAQTAINTTNAFGRIYQNYAEQNLKLVDQVKGQRSRVPYVEHKDYNLADYLKTPKIDPSIPAGMKLQRNKAGVTRLVPQ